MKNEKLINEVMGLVEKEDPSAITPPAGVSSEIVDAVIGPVIDNTFYRYEDMAAEIKSMPVEPKIHTGLCFLDDLLDGGYQEGELIILSAPTKHGKCFQKGTEILMYDGSIKKIEDIKIGDKVMGNDSSPRNVLSLGRGKEMMYKVTLRNGDSFVCNESHILTLRKTGNINNSRYNGVITSRRYSKGDIVNINIADYLKSSKTFKHVHKAYKSGVDFRTKKILVDPYFLGLWLGDGSSSSPAITTADEEIVEYIHKIASSCGLKVTKYAQENNNASTYAIVRSKDFKPVSRRNGCGYGDVVSMTEMLRKIGVFENKHIPDNYKINSRENRLKLLAGLIDSDGYKNNPSSIVFCNKNKVLCDDVVFLCRSLGFSVSTSSFLDKKYGNRYYKVYIGGNLLDIPVLLKYKIPNKSKKRKEVLNYSFSVERLDIGEYYGVVLDGNNLFLLADFTVVHNTSMALNMSLCQGTRGIPSLWFTLEMSWQELTRKLMQMDWENEYAGKPASLPIYYQKNQRDMSVEKIKNQIKRAKKEFGVKMIIIDHLHFLLPMDKIGSGKSQTSFLIGDIVGKLKLIAMELGVTILLIAHMKSLDVSSIPDVSSIRDSSFIAQYSDAAIIMWRERRKATAKDLEDNDDEDVYTGRVFVSLETNRRTGKTKRAIFGYINNQFYPWIEYLHLKESGDKVGSNNRRLEEIKKDVVANKQQKIEWKHD